MILGHLAVSALLHRYLEVDLAPTVAGGLFPDAVDKTLCQVLRLTPSGRMFGHSLASLALSTAVVRAFWGRRAGRGWAAGYLGHLVGDLPTAVPWLYPFASYEFPERSPGMWEILRQALSNPLRLGLEMALSVWAIGALRASRRPRSPAGGR
jgi:hypothetical protein